MNVIGNFLYQQLTNPLCRVSNNLKIVPHHNIQTDVKQLIVQTPGTVLAVDSEVSIENVCHFQMLIKVYIQGSPYLQQETSTTIKVAVTIVFQPLPFNVQEWPILCDIKSAQDSDIQLHWTQLK